MLNWMSKKTIGIALVSVMSISLLAGCGGNKDKNSNASPSPASGEAEITGTVTASGSSALLPLVKQAAEDFMNKHGKVTVNVTGGGSGTGLKNVADGTSDIGNSDVEAGPDYADKGLVDHVVAVAAFALITHKDVNVDSVTKQQAIDILSGKITNWKEIGGNDQKIVVVTRPSSSGSRKLVQKIVLGDAEFTKDAIEQAESGAVKTAVASTAGAIGYIDTPYIDDSLKALKFDGVEFSEENIKSGSYPLYGIEHMYTKGEPTGAVKAFLDYIMSEEVQNTTVKDIGFLRADTLNK